MSESLSPDRWHYLEYRDGHHDGQFVEWKYFNFVTAGLVGYIIYYVLDPERHTHLGGARLLTRIFAHNRSQGSLSHIPMDQVQFGATDAGVEMGSARIVEQDPHTFSISGTMKDSAWDLVYSQKEPTIYSFAQVNPGLLSWETVNWIVKMPKARVVGKVTVAGEVHTIDGHGYSDTNWGELVPFSSRYEWGQSNGPDYSLLFGLIYGLRGVKKAYLYLTYQDLHLALEEVAGVSTHEAWAKAEGGLSIPEKTRLTFDDGTYRVHIHTSLITHDTLGLKISRLLPKPVVSEQIVTYRIQVEKNGERVASLEGVGFKEWSTTTWRTVPIEF